MTAWKPRKAWFPGSSSQTILSWLFAKIYSLVHLGEKSGFTERFLKKMNLEWALLIGTAVFLVGAAANLYILIQWLVSGFGALNTVRVALFASTLMILGIQTIFSGFLISILGIKS